MYQSLRRVTVPLLVALVFGLLPTLPATHARAATNRIVATTADGPVVQTGCTSILDFCSLREALAAAADGDTIQFHPQVTGTIMLDPTQGALSVLHSVTIQGPGAAVLAVDGGANAGKGSAVPVFTAGGVQLIISGLTIQNGFNTATSDTSSGGGIAAFASSVVLTGCVVRGNYTFGNGGGINASAVTLTDTTVSDNIAGNIGGGISILSLNPEQGNATLTRTLLQRNASRTGGGLFNEGTTTISNSTIADNTASTFGGGLDVVVATITGTTLTGNRATGNSGGAISMERPSGSTTISASTITGNTVGGGIYNPRLPAQLRLAGTIVAGNSVTNGGSALDVYGPVTSQGYNLIGDGTSTTITPAANAGTDQVGTATAPLDPRFDPRGLRDNGGPTPTVGLLPNSPAIDAGGPCATGATGTTDQRGQPRVGICDTGAYEYQPVSPTVADMTIGVGGGLVTVQGTGFQTGSKLTVGATTVTATAADVNADGSQLRLTIPAHAAGAVPFTVTNPGGQHAAGTLTYAAPSPLPPSAPTGTGSTGNPAAQPGPRPAKAPSASGTPNPLPTGR